MDKYENYLSAVGRNLFFTFQDPFKILDNRIGQQPISTDSNQSETTDPPIGVKTWDQMSHEERNHYLYG